MNESSFEGWTGLGEVGYIGNDVDAEGQWADYGLDLDLSFQEIKVHGKME